MVGICQKTDQLELDTVRVLILIHHNITESLLVCLQHIRAGFKKLYGLHKQIVKIERIIFSECFLIFHISTTDTLLLIIPDCL